MVNNPVLLSPWTKKWDPALDKLIEYGTLKSFQAGAVIFSETEPSQNVYVLIKGRIKLTMNYPHGSELLVAIYEDKGLFGIHSILDGAPQFATATTLKKCDILVIRPSVFFTLLESQPDLNRAVLRCLSMEIRQFLAQLSCAALTDASARVARLLSITAKADQSDIDQPMLITTHDEIGSILGLSRVSVTNILNSLEDVGIIKKKRSHIIISNPENCECLLDNKKSIRSKAVE